MGKKFILSLVLSFTAIVAQAEPDKDLEIDFVPQSKFSGGWTGSGEVWDDRGGDAVVCFKSDSSKALKQGKLVQDIFIKKKDSVTGEIKEYLNREYLTDISAVYSLDRYIYEKVLSVDLSIIKSIERGSNIEWIVKDLLEKLVNISPVFSEALMLKRQKVLLGKWKAEGVRNIQDEGFISPPIKTSCVVAQVAQRSEKKGRIAVFYDKSLRDRMSKLDLIFLYIHEIVYAFASERGHLLSDRSRFLTAMLLSGNFWDYFSTKESVVEKEKKFKVLLKSLGMNEMNHLNENSELLYFYWSFKRESPACYKRRPLVMDSPLQLILPVQRQRVAQDILGLKSCQN